MTACTDDERREVARRLRKTSVERYNSILSGIHLGESVGVCAQIVSPHEDQVRAAADRLADLIEPDTTTDTTKTPTDTTNCDRDALLALADNLDSSASMLLKQNDLDPNRKRRGMRRDHAKSLMAASDRIREALRVTADADA